MKNLMMVSFVALTMSLTACNPNMWRGHTGKQGIQGEKGDKGDKGDQGDAGVSCSVVAVAGGAELTCGDTTTLISDGLQGATGATGAAGQDGTNGQDAQQITAYGLCPGKPLNGGFEEHVLKIGTQVFAVYASGQKIGLTALLENVVYATTDGRNCQFKIVNGSVVVLN